MNNKSRDAALSFLQEVLVRKLMIIRKRFLFTFCSSLLFTNLFIFSRWEMPNVNNFKFKSVLWLLMGLCSTFFQWCNICPPKSKWDKWTFFIYTGMLLQFFVNLLRNSSQTSKIIITISIQDFMIIYLHPQFQIPSQYFWRYKTKYDNQRSRRMGRNLE